MTIYKAIIAAIALSGLSVGAYAAEDKAGKAGAKGSSFQTADSDGNGAISMDEARTVPGLAENFAKADKNGDGQLSKSEYESALKGSGKAKKGDKSGQGKQY